MGIFQIFKRQRGKAEPVTFPDAVTLGLHSGGPTILITAGMDGDEYAAIKAANTLKKDLMVRNFPGVIHIVPIVNKSGFHAHTGKNPVDGKFPKEIFPGNPRGTESDRIIHALWSTYGRNTTYWVDLHGGSTTERLSPFVWGYVTGVADFDAKTRSLLKTIDYPKMVVSPWHKVTTLAKRGVFYILFEAGDLGTRKKEDISLLIHWVHTVLEWILGQSKEGPLTCLGNLHYYRFPSAGHWRPSALSSHVTAATLIGTLAPVSSGKTIPISIETEGDILWQNVGSIAVKHDVAAVVAESRISEQ